MLEDYPSTIEINGNTVNELLNFKLLIVQILDNKESEFFNLIFYLPKILEKLLIKLPTSIAMKLVKYIMKPGW